jgi:hypothetical protein
VNAEPNPLPVRPAAAPPPAPGPVRAQRLALLAAVIVVAWLVLNLFASILLPFVAASGIAYVLDPPCTRR